MPCRESEQPIVIAHRGASGYVPEHTLAAYALAIQMDADFIEPDLVMTRDGVLVARHENEISGTTDVAGHPEFASRRTEKTIDGMAVEGWFTEDFTRAELKTLRAKERLPLIRSASRRLDRFFPIPTLAEVLDLARAANLRIRLQADRQGVTKCRCVGVYPEIKHPTYFAGIGLAMEEPLVRQLRGAGFSRETAKAFIQCFEVGSLKLLRKMTDLPLMQLLDVTGGPHDLGAKGDLRTWADLAKPEGLAAIASYAEGIAANKGLMIPRDDDSLGAPTSLVADAHAAGLIVHGWTFRAENCFLPTDFRGGGGAADAGDLEGELATFLALGMDGFFTDQPNVGVRARDAFVTR